jgi:hypothetical protein
MTSKMNLVDNQFWDILNKYREWTNPAKPGHARYGKSLKETER